MIDGHDVRALRRARDAGDDLLGHVGDYLDALAFQGQAYVKNGDTGKAIAAYEKALKAEPSFSWVRDNLLPAARKQPAK